MTIMVHEGCNKYDRKEELSGICILSLRQKREHMLKKTQTIFYLISKNFEAINKLLSHSLSEKHPFKNMFLGCW